MSQIIIHAAKINSSRLIARVEAGEEIILARWLSMGLQTAADLSPSRPRRRQAVVTVPPQKSTFTLGQSAFSETFGRRSSPKRAGLNLFKTQIRAHWSHAQAMLALINR